MFSDVNQTLLSASPWTKAVVAMRVELLSADCVVVVGFPGRFTDDLIVGFGYVPDNDPPAVPDGFMEDGLFYI